MLNFHQYSLLVYIVLVSLFRKHWSSILTFLKLCNFQHGLSFCSRGVHRKPADVLRLLPPPGKPKIGILLTQSAWKENEVSFPALLLSFPFVIIIPFWPFLPPAQVLLPVYLLITLFFLLRHLPFYAHLWESTSVHHVLSTIICKFSSNIDHFA